MRRTLAAVLIGLAAPTGAAEPGRVVPSEWVSTLTGLLNNTGVFGGLVHVSARDQAVVTAAPDGHSKLWRNDLLSIYSFDGNIGSSGSGSVPCEREQLYENTLLTLLDFLLAPGTTYMGSDVISGRPCDVWMSPFGGPYGKFVCLETVAALPYQRPVRYWLKLPALEFTVDFEADFAQLDDPSGVAFKVPDGCPEPEVTQLPPLGLADSFEAGRVASFWMPPLAKYYTYEAGPPPHISVQTAVARVGQRAAVVNVQPGDVPNQGTERDELDLPLLRVGGRELYFSWSFMLALNFGISRNRVVFGQWKQSSLFTQSPVIALRLRDRRLVLSVRNVTLELPDDDEVEFTMVEDTRLGQWYDVTFGFNFSHGPEGFVKAWVNGMEAASYSGPIMSRADEGFFDFHFGVYRDRWPMPQTLFLDEFKVTDSLPAANARRPAPGGGERWGGREGGDFAQS